MDHQNSLGGSEDKKRKSSLMLMRKHVNGQAVADRSTVVIFDKV